MISEGVHEEEEGLSKEDLKKILLDQGIATRAIYELNRILTEYDA
jgi:hypothetical protein